MLVKFSAAYLLFFNVTLHIFYAFNKIFFEKSTNFLQCYDRVLLTCTELPNRTVLVSGTVALLICMNIFYSCHSSIRPTFSVYFYSSNLETSTSPVNIPASLLVTFAHNSLSISLSQPSSQICIHNSLNLKFDDENVDLFFTLLKHINLENHLMTSSYIMS